MFTVYGSRELQKNVQIAEFYKISENEQKINVSICGLPKVNPLFIYHFFRYHFLQIGKLISVYGWWPASGEIDIYEGRGQNPQEQVGYVIGHASRSPIGNVARKIIFS